MQLSADVLQRGSRLPCPSCRFLRIEEQATRRLFVAFHPSIRSWLTAEGGAHTPFCWDEKHVHVPSRRTSSKSTRKHVFPGVADTRGDPYHGGRPRCAVCVPHYETALGEREPCQDFLVWGTGCAFLKKHVDHYSAALPDVYGTGEGDTKALRESKNILLNADSRAQARRSTVSLKGLPAETSRCRPQILCVLHQSSVNHLMSTLTATSVVCLDKPTQRKQGGRAIAVSSSVTILCQKANPNNAGTASKSNRLTHPGRTRSPPQSTSESGRLAPEGNVLPPSKRKYYCWNRNPAARYPKKGNKGARPVCRAMRRIRKRLRTGR